MSGFSLKAAGGTIDIHQRSEPDLRICLSEWPPLTTATKYSKFHQDYRITEVRMGWRQTVVGVAALLVLATIARAGEIEPPDYLAELKAKKDTTTIRPRSSRRAGR